MIFMAISFFLVYLHTVRNSIIQPTSLGVCKVNCGDWNQLDVDEPLPRITWAKISVAEKKINATAILSNFIMNFMLLYTELFSLVGQVKVKSFLSFGDIFRFISTPIFANPRRG